MDRVLVELYCLLGPLVLTHFNENGVVRAEDCVRVNDERVVVHYLVGIVGLPYPVYVKGDSARIKRLFSFIHVYMVRYEILMSEYFHGAGAFLP